MSRHTYRSRLGKRADAKREKSRRKMRREQERRQQRYDSEDAANMCTRKFRYDSRYAAERYIERHYSEKQLSTYRCPYCGGWHLTSHPRVVGHD